MGCISISGPAKSDPVQPIVLCSLGPASPGGARRLSRHAWLLLPAGGDWSQPEEPGTPGDVEGLLLPGFWAAASWSPKMGTSLALLSSCQSLSWRCCAGRSGLPRCSTLQVLAAQPRAKLPRFRVQCEQGQTCSHTRARGCAARTCRRSLGRCWTSPVGLRVRTHTCSWARGLPAFALCSRLMWCLVWL